MGLGRTRRLWEVAALLGVCLGAAGAPPSARAQADERWVLLAFESPGVSPSDVRTFEMLLQHALQEHSSVSVQRSEASCGDDACAAQQARSAQADHAVYGTLSTLGKKIIVQVSVVASEGTRTDEQRMTVDQVEDLDAVATRIARAITSGGRAEQDAQLGTVTEAETRGDKSRGGRSAFALDLGMVVPVESSYANVDLGIGFGLGYWFETRHFALTPRVGMRFSIDDSERVFRIFLADITAHYIPLTGDFSPVIGLGAGVNTLREKIPTTVTTGEVLVTESEYVRNDFGVGFGLLARLGVMLMRTYAMRLMVSADYQLSLVDVNGDTVDHAIVVNFHALMGGSG